MKWYRIGPNRMRKLAHLFRDAQAKAVGESVVVAMSTKEARALSEILYIFARKTEEKEAEGHAPV